MFRQDSDNLLTLSTYWADAGSAADLADWNNSTAIVPFSAPVKIRYVAEYNDAAPDSVKVYVNGVLTISGEGFEAYHAAVGSDPQVIDSLLFRTSRNVPVLGGAWDVVEPTAPRRPRSSVTASTSAASSTEHRTSRSHRARRSSCSPPSRAPRRSPAC